MKKRWLFLSLLLVVLSWFGTVYAHDLWLVPEPRHPSVGETVRLLAQTGMKFPESLSAVAPDRLDGAWLVDPSGRREITEMKVDGKSLVLQTRLDNPGVALAAVSVEPKFIHLNAADFNDYLDHDGLPQILELRKKTGQLEAEAREMYAKLAKAILKVGEGGPQDLATKPAGLRIEIVPLEDPHKLSASGGPLPVQVLWESRPLQGVYVYALADGEDKYLEGYETDASGKTVVTIKGAGLWSLHSIYMRPYNDKSKADWESFFATTTFLVEGTN
jgi:uncharacterized GH25 family protein